MKTKIEFISPEQAIEILENNTINRRIRKTHIEFFAKCIQQKEFSCTHQGIAIDKEGKLIDGQHRLLAIVKTNIGVNMMVSRECESSIFGYVDRGINRDVSDILKESAYMVAIANAILHFAHPIFSKWTNLEIKNVLNKLKKDPLKVDIIESRGIKTVKCANFKMTALYFVDNCENPKLVKESYLRMSKGLPEKNMEKAFIQQILKGMDLKVGGSVANIVFEKFFYILNPKNINLKTLKMDDQALPLMRKWAISLSEF